MIYNLSQSDTLPNKWSSFAEPLASGLNHSQAARRTAVWDKWETTTKALSNIKVYSVPGQKMGALFFVRALVI